jgi:hypothetical protein
MAGTVDLIRFAAGQNLFENKKGGPAESHPSASRRLISAQGGRSGDGKKS